MPRRDTRESARTPAAITFGRLRNLLQDPYTEMESIVDLVRRSARVARFALDLPGESGRRERIGFGDVRQSRTRSLRSALRERGVIPPSFFHPNAATGLSRGTWALIRLRMHRFGLDTVAYRALYVSRSTFTLPLLCTLRLSLP